MRHKRLLVVHCADTYASMDIGSAEITKWHLARGWAGNGYAFIIRRCGTLELGRDLDGDGDVIEETGAHAVGFNRKSIGICLVGGRGRDEKPEANFTPQQLVTLRSLLYTLKAWNPELEVVGHCDLPGVSKTCPNFDVKKWYLTGEIA